MSNTREQIDHHLTEAIRNLSVAAEYIRELAGVDADVTEHLALVAGGAVETVRDIRGEIAKQVASAAQSLKGRTPRKPDRRAGDRRATKRRVDDKRKATLRSRKDA